MQNWTKVSNHTKWWMSRGDKLWNTTLQGLATTSTVTCLVGCFLPCYLFIGIFLVDPGWYRFAEPAGTSLPLAKHFVNGQHCNVCQTTLSAGSLRVGTQTWEKELWISLYALENHVQRIWQEVQLPARKMVQRPRYSIFINCHLSRFAILHIVLSNKLNLL